MKSNSLKTFMLFAILAILSALIFYTQRIRKSVAKLEPMNNLTEEEKRNGILTPEIMWKLGRIGTVAVSPDQQYVVSSLTRYELQANKGVTNLILINLNNNEKVELTDGDSHDHSATWSKDSKTIYFLSNRGGEEQLWSIGKDGTDLHSITDIDGGIENYAICGSDKHVAYSKTIMVDPHEGTILHSDLPENKAKIYDDLMVRHFHYWNTGSYRHLFIAPLTDKPITQGTDIMPGEAWDAPIAPYFDNSDFTWNHAGTQLVYACKKLTGTEYARSTNSDLYLYDLYAASTRNLTEGMPGYEREPHFAPDDSKIAFWSMERPGNEADKKRLFTLSLATGEKQYLTAEFDYNAQDIHWKSNQEIAFIAPIEATHQVCRIDLTQPKPKVETITQGDHDLSKVESIEDRWVVRHETHSSAPELMIVNTDNTLSPLTEINKPTYEQLHLGKVEKRWITTSDRKKMLTWVIYPPNFDPKRKYPTLLYCQGGPQSVVSQFWSYRWNFQLMAAQGYIVVAPNRRGLPSFGQEWLDQISGDYSGQNMRDYLAAIDEVAHEPYVDKERLGCVGASYGGYSVFYLAGHHQKRFKAFIAHCGMFNFESFYGSTEELWFPNNDFGGSYWSENPTAKRSYDQSPHRFVKQWDTPILIFAGEKDYRIPYTESLQAFTAARAQGIPARLVVFENEGHLVIKPQNSIVWNREFFNWLAKHLKTTNIEE